MPMPVVTSRQLKGGAGVVGAIAIATPFIIGWEGFEPVARHDPIDPPGVITACNGITNYDLPGLKAGTRFTEGECAVLLKKAIPKYAAPVDKCVKVEISDNTRAALYSAAYNLGAGTVCASGMVRKINAGDLQGGCDALLHYGNICKTVNGSKVCTPVKGLVNRRQDERRLCLSLPTTRGTVAAPAPKAPQPTPPKKRGFFEWLRWLFS